MGMTLTKTMLGQEQDKAYVKTAYFATNFNGSCEINTMNYLSHEAREAGESNGVLERVNIEPTESVKAKLDQMNQLAYEILAEQKGYEEGVEL